jgi:iron complex transport system ATP-binding protein
MRVLQTYDLSIGYKKLRQSPSVVAANLSLELFPGELVCVLGPNGAGKTTLLRTLAGMQSPLSGRVLINEHDLNALSPQDRARHLSIVLTDRVDVGTLSVYALVALGRYPYTDWQGRLTAADEEVVRWAIQVVGAEPLVSRNVGELSDGERQKVMIARALAQEPHLMILDEPTAFLDLPRRVEIMTILRKLVRDTQRAILLSTHDLDLALRHADKIWLMPFGGKLQVGTPEDLVLSGAFESAFHSEGVSFDPQTGSFRSHTQESQKVVLIGEGLPTIWTERALQRIGYEVVRDNSHQTATIIEIISEANMNRWKVSQNGTTQSCHSIDELIAALAHQL